MGEQAPVQCSHVQGPASAFTFHWVGSASVLAPGVPRPGSGCVLCWQVVKNGDATKGEAKAVQLEIWGAGRLLKEVFVAPSVHRAVYTDGS